MIARWGVLTLFVMSLAGCGSCGREDDDDDGSSSTSPAPPPAPPPPPPPPGTTTENPTVPPGTAPPYGVTWHIGINQNVSQAQMDALYATFIAINDTLWNISEGQVRVHRIRIWDNVAPSLTATAFVSGAPVDTSNLDILVFNGSSWDVGAGGAVGEGYGRTGRIMIVPSFVTTFVGTHEGSHFLFQLSWSPGPLLVDEYQDGVQDAACVMESETPPLRWCSSGNHAAQSSQPQSCWSQILADYPAFAYAGTNTAGTAAPAPIVEYFNAP